MNGPGDGWVVGPELGRPRAAAAARGRIGARGVPMKLPHLSLRDLFWLVLVAGMGFAVWLSWRREGLSRERAIFMEREAGFWKAMHETQAEATEAIELHWRQVARKLDDD